ncbi:MAG: STAS domain-containing protein [Armatimonadota bacterium]|nr:STAS domain-containing protein [Armatimonadota bacterium]
MRVLGGSGNGKRPFAILELDNVLAVRGEVGRTSAAELRRRLKELEATYPTVVVDLAAVTHMKSDGFAALLGAGRSFQRRGGRLVLRHTAPHIRRMLEVTEMLPLFRME